MATDSAKEMSQRLYRVSISTEEDAGVIIEAADMILKQSNLIERLTAERDSLRDSSN